MSGKGAKAPDYGEIAEVSKYSADMQMRQAEGIIDWQKEMWAEQKDLIERVLDSELTIGDAMWKAAQEDRQRYKDLYYKPEEDFLNKAMTWGSDENMSQAAARAQADVRANFEAQRRNALGQLESYGVDPSQTRYGALDLGTRVAEATATAQAGTASSTQRELEHLGFLGESINLGRGLPSQGLQYSGQALNAYNSASQNSAAWQGAAQAMGSPYNYFAGANQATSNWGNALTGQFNADTAAWNQGWGGFGRELVMGGAQAAAAAGGAKFASMLKDGGEVRAIPTMADGGQLTSYGASPYNESSAGPVGEVRGPGGPRDDAIPTRLSDGEYVIPEHAVRWYGVEKLDKFVQKATEAQQQRAGQAQVTQHALAIPPEASRMPTSGQGQ